MCMDVFNSDIHYVVLPKCDRHILCKTDVDQMSLCLMCLIYTAILSNYLYFCAN